MKNKLRELASVFLKLGLTAFGGPAAHIAMMQDEVVRKRQWMSEQHFLDQVGVSDPPENFKEAECLPADLT